MAAASLSHYARLMGAIVSVGTSEYTHIFNEVPGAIAPGFSVECVAWFLHRTLIGRQDARTLLYSISRDE